MQSYCIEPTSKGMVPEVLKGPEPMVNQKSNRFDVLGIVGSAACALHCLLVPLLPSIAPSISVFFGSEWVHIGLVTCLIPIALIAFQNGKKRHGKNIPFILGLVGVVFLLSAIGSESFEIHGLEKPLTLLGSAFLVSAHVLNFQSQKKQSAL